MIQPRGRGAELHVSATGRGAVVQPSGRGAEVQPCGGRAELHAGAPDPGAEVQPRGRRDTELHELKAHGRDTRTPCRLPTQAHGGCITVVVAKSPHIRTYGYLTRKGGRGQGPPPEEKDERAINNQHRKKLS